MALLLFFLTLALIPEPCCYGQALITLHNKNNKNKKQEEESIYMAHCLKHAMQYKRMRGGSGQKVQQNSSSFET